MDSSSTTTSAAAPRPVCLFFKRDGNCFKGSACRFSHDLRSPAVKSNVTCRYFLSGACMFGDACAFTHSFEPNQTFDQQIVVEEQQGGVEELVVEENNDDEEETVWEDIDGSDLASEQNIETAAASEEVDNSNLVLNLPTSYEHDSDYHYLLRLQAEEYGCHDHLEVVANTGTTTATPPTTTTTFLPNQMSEPVFDSSSRPMCTFFLAGTCRYGTSCRFRHEQNHVFGSMVAGAVEETVEDISSNTDCGICLAPPTDGVYGMLNACECVFCLSCVREWRSKNEDQRAAKKKAHRLCPLCRRESYYVVPISNKVLKAGARKDNYVEAYRSSLAIKKCKHIIEKGECPFGRSCFYNHDIKEEEMLPEAVIHMKALAAGTARRLRFRVNRLDHFFFDDFDDDEFDDDDDDYDDEDDDEYEDDDDYFGSDYEDLDEDEDESLYGW